MVVRVATQNIESAKHLVVDLVDVVGDESVSLQPDGEVHLQLRGDVNGALVQTLQAVERWLEQTGTASAEVSVDERSYTVEQAGSSRASVPANGTRTERPFPIRSR